MELACVTEFQRSIRAFWPKGPSIPLMLYHYTNADAAHGILSNNSVWFTSAKDMVDAGEVQVGESAILRTTASLAGKSANPNRVEFLAELQEEIKHQGPTRQPGLYLWSLTPENDTPQHWQSYGDQGRGVSLGLAFEGMRNGKGLATGRSGELHEIEFRLVKCLYSEVDVERVAGNMLERVSQAYETFVEMYPRSKPDAIKIAGTYCMNYLSEVAASLKAEAFSWEQEWRVYTLIENGEVAPEIRMSARGSIAYLPVNGLAVEFLKDVQIGPSAKDSQLRQSLHQVLATRRPKCLARLL
ncbi:MAG: DUF2971 domain-containing protein [Acidobacteriota bacterium]